VRVEVWAERGSSWRFLYKLGKVIYFRVTKSLGLLSALLGSATA